MPDERVAVDTDAVVIPQREIAASTLRNSWFVAPCASMTRVIAELGIVQEVDLAIRECWGLHPTAVGPVEGGMNSMTFTAELEVGRYIAKWVPLRDGEHLRAGARAARIMDAAGIRSGAPLPTVGGALTAPVAGGHLALLEFVPGNPLTAAVADQAVWGRTLGEVHSSAILTVGASFFDWVERDGTVGHHPRWVREAAERVAAEMGSLPSLSWVQLHTDPAPEAFLRDDDGRIGVIDWTGSTAGPALYDVASAVMYAGGETMAATFIEAYLNAAPISPEELTRYLPVFHRFRAVVQAVYFAGRVNESNFLGGGGDEANEKGLDDASHMLERLGVIVR